MCLCICLKVCIDNKLVTQIGPQTKISRSVHVCIYIYIYFVQNSMHLSLSLSLSLCVENKNNIGSDRVVVNPTWFLIISWPTET